MTATACLTPDCLFQWMIQGLTTLLLLPCYYGSSWGECWSEKWHNLSPIPEIESQACNWCWTFLMFYSKCTYFITTWSNPKSFAGCVTLIFILEDMNQEHSSRSHSFHMCSFPSTLYKMGLAPCTNQSVVPARQFIFIVSGLHIKNSNMSWEHQ